MTASPRSFAAWFSDVKSWDVRSTGLRLIKVCHWPTIRLGSVSAIRFEIIPDSDIKAGSVDLLDRISFDAGEVHSGKRRETRMTQYRACSGDIVVSKINARKRAIGIVAPGKDIGITIHFRALKPEPLRVDSQFLWLALRSSFCTNQFLSETGGIGKGEISESRLLEIEVPLPPLASQKAIIAHWRKAREKIAVAEENARIIEAEMDAQFLADLGLRPPATSTAPKCFAIHWTDTARWGVNAVRDEMRRPNSSGAKFPIVRLSQVLADLENGWSPKCFPRPATDQEWGVLKLGAVSFGVFNPAENKALPASLRPRTDCEIRVGDMLISRANITRLVGACALVEETPPRLLLCDKIFRAVWRKPENIDKQFLTTVLKIPHVRWQIENKVTGGSPTMKNITKPNLLSLEFPLPPIPIQRQIMEKMATCRARIARERETARTLAIQVEADIEAYLLGTKKVGVA